MALSTRRQFVQQTALAGASLCVRPIQAFAGLQDILTAGERNEPPVDPAAIRALASKITGHVITPEAPDYETARLVFNRAFDQRPALIVRCAGASDIAWVLDFAQSHNLPLAVRGGGHSRAGLSTCDGGVVIDLSAMNRVEWTLVSAWREHSQVPSCAIWTGRRSDSVWLPLWVVVLQ
jgi:FAD binding domain-containing protein